MKKILFLILPFICSIAQAQITSRVVDQNGESLPMASVALYENDELVTGSTTDENGRFSINAPRGSYRLTISFISFETKSLNVEVPNSQETITLGTIEMKEASNALEEVTVEAQSNMMEFEQDKRVFNVSKDVTNIGSNASDILDNIPSVSLDVDGNVSLRGSQNVRILIDGKPSGLVGSDPASALRQLQSSMIEKIEVITNPSARYDAEGEAGIINIVLKKDERKGFNGTFEATAGYPDNYGVSAGVNYRMGRLNWFANGSINYRNSPGGGFSDQQFSYEDTTYSFYRDQDRTRGGTRGALRFGADYEISDNQTITGTFLFRPSLGNNISNITYNDFDQNGNLQQIVHRNDDEIEESLTLESDLHYEKIFNDNKDHKWTADFKFQDEDDMENSDILQDTAGSENILQQKVSNQEDEQNILIQTDYVHPWSEDRSFEVGSKAIIRDIINNYSVTELNESGEYVPLADFTNNFRYLENIYSAYAIYNDGIGKLTYQLGLRGEYSDISASVESEDASNDQNYFNLFPSIFLTWDINIRSDIQLNYSRRISRPHFRQLLPFSSFSDNRNFRAGNPFLRPEYTDSYEMGYVRYFEKATLYSGIYYRHRTGVVERISTVDSTGFTTQIPVNLAVQDAYGFEFNLSYDATEWWTLNANMNLYRAITSGSFEGVDYGNDNFTSQGRFTNQLKFWESNLQLSFNYRGPAVTAQGRRLGIYTADIGWSRDILQGKATISASVRDVFNTRKWRAYTSGPNFDTYSEFQWRQRQFLLTLVYRINQSNVKKKQGEGGFDDEDFGM